MKVALVVKEFCAGRGGAERYAVDLGCALLELGHQVEVLAERWDEGLRQAGFRFHRIRTIPRLQALRLLSFHWGVGRLLRRLEFDRVLGLAQFHPQQVYVLLEAPCRLWLEKRYPRLLARAARCLMRPVLLVNRYLENRILGAAHHPLILTNSACCKRQIEAAYDFPGGRIAVLHNAGGLRPADPRQIESWRAETRARLGVREGEPLLLFASMNFRRKGLFELIRSLALLEDRRFLLAVAGRGSRRACRRLAEKCGIADRVVCLGQLADMRPVLAGADLFVLPTHGDSFANSCLEALEFGLPVVTTEQNGFAEAIEPGKNGWIVDRPENLAGLADCIRRFLDAGPAERRELSERARASAQRFSRGNFLRGLEGWLEATEPARHGAAALPDPGMVVDRADRGFLEGAGLRTFDQVMAFAGFSRVVKGLPRRAIGRFTAESDGRERAFYLKRHDLRLSPWMALKALLGFEAESPGMAEFRSLLAFESRGLPTARPVAAGERSLGVRRRQSFLITEALEEHRSLEEFVPRDYAALNRRRQLELIDELARLTASMHGAYFSHKDYYFGDIFIRRQPQPSANFKIIDLQRLDRRRWFGRRWRTKDVAEIHYSAQLAGVSGPHRLRFFKAYCGKAPGEKLSPGERRWIRRIISRTGRIRRHAVRQERRAP